MENLYVSDLFGYGATNESLIIIINVNKPQNLFEKIANSQFDDTSIWKYNKKLINDILSERNIDPKTFLILGYILSKSNILPKNIILANINICLQSEQYEDVISYGKGNIVRPYNITNKGKKIYSIGLCYFDNDSNFDISEIGIIPDKFLVDYVVEKKSYDKLDCNEFGLFSFPKFGIKTLARTQEIRNKFKLLNGNDKYLTVITDDDSKKNKLTTKQGLNSMLSQLFSYTAQGELINEGKCVSYKNSKIVTESCDSENSNQKWVISQNKILPSNDFGKCLDVSTLDQSIVQLNDCNSVETQEWDTEIENNNFDSDNDVGNVGNIASTKSGDYEWAKYKGKTLALVENDNPWFINSDIVKKIKQIGTHSDYIDNIQNDEIPEYQPNYLINMRLNENYKSNFVIDPNSSSLGHGYSFKSRGCNSCVKNSVQNRVEHFDSETNEQNKYPVYQQILIIVGSLIILLILYKIWKSNQ